ncbi:MAG: 5'-nucleotidase C-terminal domain-containing protein [Bacteroidia bacterium]|nr:5'-nucleotidase C-terminal domain-containing protein [Bacteroidia bacterium]
MKDFPLKNRISSFIILLVLLSACRTNTFLSSVDTDRLTLSDTTEVVEDTEILEIISPYKMNLDAQMDRVIGKLVVDLYKSRPESTLGNWMTDIILERVNTYAEEPIDFAVQNYGGIRVPEIKKGDITVRHIFELMPFENAIVVMEVDGSTMWQMIERMALSGGWPVSSGFQMVISKDRKPLNVLIQGKPFDSSKTYRFALPDYIANGGDRCDFLIALPRVDLGLKVRDAIIEYLEQHNEPMSAELENRVTRVEN